MQAPIHKNLNPVIEIVSAAIVGDASNQATTNKRGGGVVGGPVEILGVSTHETSGSGTATVTISDVNSVVVFTQVTMGDTAGTLDAAVGVAPFTVTTTGAASTPTLIVHIFVRK